MSSGGAGSTAVTRPILPSADLAATSAFYAGPGFVEVGRGVPPGLHGNLMRVGCPS